MKGTVQFWIIGYCGSTLAGLRCCFEEECASICQLSLDNVASELIVIAHNFEAQVLEDMDDLIVRKLFIHVAEYEEVAVHACLTYPPPVIL